MLVLLLCSVARISTLPIHKPVPRSPSHQNGYYDYEGVIHWHTGYSGDANGTYETIAELGNQQQLDFLITTEHNNLMALHDHKEGWHGRMLTLVAVESTRREGYLLGMDLHRFTTQDSSTDDFLTELSQQGGYAIIAHPKNPRWSWQGTIDQRIAGQEIVDLTDEFTIAAPVSILKALIYCPFNFPAAIMQLYQYPADALKMWDEQTSQRHFTGIYASDAHQSIRVWGRHLFKFPKAVDVLPVAHDHIILTTPFSGDFSQDKPRLYEAIRQGRLYFSIDTLQDATGFLFWARQENKTALMGDQLQAGVKTDFFVKLPQQVSLKNAAINVYHNGTKIIDHALGPEYAFKAVLPGSYRIEVEVDIPTFWGFGKRVTWIYSNPIYLR